MPGTKVDQKEAEEYFERWYVKPLQLLDNIPNGDGGFIALAVSCFLYERYADAVIKELGKKSKITEQLMTDFGIDKETAETFWDVMRNGILHKAMPKQKDHSSTLPGWRFLPTFPNQ